MESAIGRHLPLITPRIEFLTSKTLGPLPVISPRIDFQSTSILHTNSTTLLSSGDVESESETMETVDMLPDNDNKSIYSVSDSEGMEEDAKPIRIRKPSGEPGRPRSGGYNIEEKLPGWGAELITDINKFVKKKADTTLDTTKSYSKQKSSDLTALCVLTKKFYPIVDKYENYWPVRDMLKLYLKYTSENHRRQHMVTKSRKGKTKKVVESEDDKDN